ncbi:hypothetical protein MAR_001605 [Mya arenaria]|uniref:B box-type domain-containing protein n=1 Tax=Mya arenaria TaxID=6604 RepID=A0ABY7FFK0_MYAAR|nr:uncharacterized protein LOC128208253 [Mya arenaria]WAR19767.1 hypothetical protein MAR_001605 [Mya arenaria]
MSSAWYSAEFVGKSPTAEKCGGKLDQPVLDSLNGDGAVETHLPADGFQASDRLPGGRNTGCSGRPASGSDGRPESGSSGRPASACSDLSCENHPEMILDTFCGFHDEVLCQRCVTLHHRFCTGLTALSEMKDLAKSKDVKRSVKDLTDARERLIKIKQAKQEEIKRIDHETAQAIKDLEDFRELINWVLDRMERKGKEYLQKRHKEFSEDVKADLATCNDTLFSIEKQLKKASKEESEKGNLAKRFVKLKKDAAILQKASSIISSMKNTEKSRPLIKFTVDPKVEQFARSLSWYGKDKTYLACEPAVSFPHLYTVKADNQFDIRCKGERNVCVISDGCQMPDGTLLLVDEANVCMKQLDVLYKLVDCLKLPAKPLCIAHVNDGTAAVALDTGADSVLQLIKIGSKKSTLDLSFTVYGKCTGLASDGEFLFVATINAITQYSLTGDHVKDIHKDTNLTFGKVVLGIDRETFWTISHRRTVVALDMSGEVLGSIDAGETSDTLSIAMDNLGHIFTAGHTTNSVTQFKHDFEKLGAVLNHKNGVKSPLTLVFDRIQRRFVVTMKGKNVVKVFDLK